MGGFYPCWLLEELYITQPAPPQGCFWVLRLFWGAGPGARGRAGRDGPAAVALMRAGTASWGLCRIQPCSPATPGSFPQTLAQPERCCGGGASTDRDGNPRLDPAMGYLSQ